MDAVWSATTKLYDNSREELDGYDLVIAIDNMLLKQNITRPALQEQVASAYKLGVLNRNDEAIAVYDDVVKRFGESTEPAIREQVERALSNKEKKLRGS